MDALLRREGIDDRGRTLEIVALDLPEAIAAAEQGVSAAEWVRNAVRDRLAG
ncbi:MAG: hypothetical protein ACOYEV_02495 [Candidatus Nanopelagicales bacterium]